MARRFADVNLVAPTRDGAVFLAMLAGVLFGAVNTGNNLVYLVLGVLLALLVVANLLAEWNLRALAVERRLPAELVAGVPTPGAFVLSNPRGRGAARQVRLLERGEGRAQALVERCPPGGSVEIAADYCFPERGAARLGSVRLESTFPFGLVRRWRDVELPGEVLVYPRPSGRGAPLAPHGDGEEAGARGRPSGAGEFAGLRPYRPGDPLRRVHWPTSARMRTPMVVVRVAEGADELVLRLEPALRGEAREEAIRRLAGRVELHLAAGDAVGLGVAAPAAHRAGHPGAPVIDAAVQLATLAGAACLALSGPAEAVGTALVAAGLLLPRRLARARDWTWLHLGVLVLCGAVAWLVGVIGGFALLLGWLAFHRARVAEGSTDQRVLLLLATLMALIGTVGTLSIALAPILLVFAVAAPVALLRVSGVQERGLERLAAAGTLTLTAGFFVLVPRVQGGLLGAAGESAGKDRFADSVALGDELDDPDRDALVMRVRAFSRAGDALRGPLYLRGRALDHFDGRAWTSSGVVRRTSVGAWETRAEVLLEPLEGATVFGPPDLLYARSDQGPILQGPEGELLHAQPGRRVSYEVYSRARALDTPDPAAAALLQLPELDPRVAELAEGLAPGSDDARVIVAAAIAHLARGYTYAQDPPRPEGDPLTWFLFESRAGHCEYFASALAVLLRERGVPARLATGFYSAEYTDAGYHAVRRGHAHAWVEVPVNGGWAVVDATPVGGLPAVEVPWWQQTAEQVNDAWLSLVLDYDLDRQMDAAASLGARLVRVPANDPIRARGKAGLAGAGAILGAVMASGVALRLVLWWLARPRAAPRRDERLLAIFRRARARLRARGWAIPAALPPVEAGDWLLAHGGEPAGALRDLAWLVYRARYAGEPVDEAELQRLVRAVQAIPAPPRGS